MSENGKRTALVIGAGSPIGRAICHALLVDGFDTQIAGPELKVAQHDCTDLGLAGALEIDLTNPTAIESAIDHLSQEDPLNSIVCCAASSSYSPLRTRRYLEWQRTIEISLTGHLNLLGACSRPEIQPRKIVLISSLNAQIAVPGYAAYCAAKAGLDALVRVAAIELAPRTIVNAVAPGPVNIPGRLSDALPAMLDATKQRHLIEPRLAEPKEIADVVAFLLSPKAAWMTGQVVTVDGGVGINYGQFLDGEKLDNLFGLKD